MAIANIEQWRVNRVFADSSVTDKPYGVESEYKGSTTTEWFTTQEEMNREHDQLIGEISWGEF